MLMASWRGCCPLTSTREGWQQPGLVPPLVPPLAPPLRQERHNRPDTRAVPLVLRNVTFTDGTPDRRPGTRTTAWTKRRVQDLRRNSRNRTEAPEPEPSGFPVVLWPRTWSSLRSCPSYQLVLLRLHPGPAGRSLKAGFTPPLRWNEYGWGIHRGNHGDHEAKVRRSRGAPQQGHGGGGGASVRFF